MRGTRPPLEEYDYFLPMIFVGFNTPIAVDIVVFGIFKLNFNFWLDELEDAS